MRPPLRFALAALALAAVAGLAHAQFGFDPRAKIDKVRIGFRPTSGGDRDTGAATNPVCKAGLWAPVSVGVEFLKVKGYRKGVLLEVVTTDCDDLQTLARYPIIPGLGDTIDPESDEFLRERGLGMRKEPSELTSTAYVKLPGDMAEVRLRLVQEDDPERALSEPEVISRTGVRTTAKYVILTLGGKLPGLEFARKEVYGGRVEQAHLDSVEDLPDQWFGYEAADLVVLPTGGPSDGFIKDLFFATDRNAPRKRRALFEWVRRGGKLVVAAGDRAGEIGRENEFSGFTDPVSKEWTPGPLPVQVVSVAKVEKVSTARNATLNPTAIEYTQREFTKGEKDLFGFVLSGAMDPKDIPRMRPRGLFAVAGLKDSPSKAQCVTLLSGTAGTAAKADRLVVQAPYGLGRVTVVGFDIDRSPFIDDGNRLWRGEFWEWLVAEAGDREAAKLPDSPAQNRGADNFNNPKAGGFGGQPQPQLFTPSRDGEDGVASALRGSVDHYDEVPVISFGWVALFILGYTLIIGPIEYILLKKLFGKLELTWITFPIIVLTVSGAAYLTAYAVKGQDLRMNKIDVVDIDVRTDPARPRVYGRTWFTVFSPRIDSYTIGVEPKENWAKTRDDRGYSPVTTVDWFGLPSKQSTGATSRGYTYEIDPRGDNSPQANGISGVPIQVWSTKAFAANWAGVADPAAPPVKADIRRQANGAINGTVSYALTLKDVDQAFAVYKGKVYPFEKAVVPGIPSPLNIIPDRTKAEPSDAVFEIDPKFNAREQAEEDDFNGPWGNRRGNTPKPTATANKDPLALWGMLFHQQASGRSGLQNGSLRPLDQSWRLSDTNESEVILLFRLKRATKQKASDLMTDPDSPSPTRVWLHGLPGRGKDTWAVDGIAQQDTYVRMYLPVKPAGGK